MNRFINSSILTIDILLRELDEAVKTTNVEEVRNRLDVVISDVKNIRCCLQEANKIHNRRHI